jgi:hypothetical protein
MLPRKNYFTNINKRVSIPIKGAALPQNRTRKQVKLLIPDPRVKNLLETFINRRGKF